VATLYRCPNPSNWLCPCGKAARALKRHGVDYDEVRVPYRRAPRDEIEVLTGQRRVPVLVLGGDAICDSKRIVEHLEHRAEARAEPQSAGRGS
jgi:glutathione S-transferase